MPTIKTLRSPTCLNLGLALLITSPASFAGEALFAKVKTAEPLPKGAAELYLKANRRSDKGQGNYTATDYSAEYEYGFSDRFTAAATAKALAIDTSGLIIDGYLPLEEDFAFKISGLELEASYNFLRPALDDIGLSTSIGLDYGFLDPHSGQDKTTVSVEVGLQLQKYLMDGALIWAGNLAMETTWADRAAIDNLPADFDWPTDPEMEIELAYSTGLSYRFAPNWFAGFEVQYEEEYETEVNRERWSWFAGPNLHYGGKQYWATLSWLEQFNGGGEKYEGQTQTNRHLIEKTETELMLQIGFNF